MGLDISKITNAELQKLANEKDVDKNGILEGKEITVFEKEAEVLEGITVKDFKETMGLYTTNPVSATEGMTEKEAKKYNKEAKEAHIKYLDSYAKDGGILDYVVEYLNEKPNLDPQFKKAVEDVVTLMPEYTSTSEIGKKHKEIEKKLDEAGIKDDLHKEVLKQLEEAAKNQVKSDAMADVADAYLKKQSDYEAQGINKNSQQIMDEIKKEAKQAGTFKGDFKDAFNDFNMPMIEAYQTVYNAISKVDKNITKGKTVQNKAEAYLKDRGQWDKYTKKALLGDRNVFKRAKNFVTGYKGDGRIASENKARFNKVENKKTQSTKEIMDSLGNKTELFVALQEAGYIKKMPDGKWDLTELSDLIGTQVGDDYKVNRHHKKDKLISEKLKTTSAMKVATGLSQLEEKHAMALVKLCGYDIEGKHAGRAIFGGILGLASGAAAGYGAATAANATIPHKYQIGGGKIELPAVEIDTPLDIDLSGQKLPEGVTINASGNIVLEISLLIKDAVNIIDVSNLMGQMALRTALPTALLGSALGVLSGLSDKGETPVLSNNFTEQTFEAYAERLRKENPKYAEVGVMIAASFLQDGKWDREGFKDFLNTMGGDGGLINREELIGGLQARLDNKVPTTKPQETTPTEPVEQTPGQTTQPSEEKCIVDVQKEKDKEIPGQDLTKIHYRKDNPNVGWKEMVEAYYPDLVAACGGKLYGPDGAIRAFQKELCTDENGSLDKAKLKALYTATDVPKEIKLPLKVKGCDRKDNKPQPHGVNNNNGTGKYIPAMDKVGRNEVTAKQVQPGVWVATDGCDDVKASGSDAATAVKNLKQLTHKEYENENDYIQ